ncbi:hypothetical protein KAI04_02900 [Candidatus Pacearchaeota archaeon]|nr:hypothetical protein [Candidatus Pacearchaeota archaeon]
MTTQEKSLIDYFEKSKDLLLEIADKYWVSPKIPKRESNGIHIAHLHGGDVYLAKINFIKKTAEIGHLKKSEQNDITCVIGEYGKKVGEYWSIGSPQQ